MIDEKPFTNPFALISFCISVRPWIEAGLDHASFCPSKTAWNTSGPPIRSNRNSSHIMFVHRDWPPRENGATPAALNFGTRLSRMSPHDCGGCAPTLSKTVLFQYRTIGVTVSAGSA